jgi:hypothetical protein
MPRTHGPPTEIEWPDGKRFAFTIVDDTEASTRENVGPIYELLYEHGLLTTKTVWPLAFRETPRFGGDTLEDPDYRAWIVELANRGFEIAFHGATDHSSLRAETKRALDRFRETLGRDPLLHANHFGQAEGMYWGDARLDGPASLLYRVVNGVLRRNTNYYGHVEGSPYFWGDLCRERITYVRNLSFSDINTLKVSPIMPYHDSSRPYVRYWFSASEGPSYDAFCQLLSESNQDRLLAEGGACIAYSHFGFGFVEDGRVREEFARLIERLADLPGWFVPASTLLDFLRSQEGWREEADRKVLRTMQYRWLGSRLLHGTT